MKQWLLIGLGNPGPRFANTRHNLGARLLRQWVSARARPPERPAWKITRRLPALLTTVTLAAAPVTCLIPLTPMNRSGQPVRRMLRRGLFTLWRQRPTYRLLIIHDDIETPLGTFRLKADGSARGHNGVRSIQAALRTTDIPRLLLGIGPKPVAGTAQFVLSPFTPAEEEKIAAVAPQIIDWLTRTVQD